MSSSIYQGLQSCLEPRLIEPRVLRLKLTPSKSNSFRPSAEETVERNTAAADRTAQNCGDTENNNGWNFLQALSHNASDNTKKDNVYVHPSMKKSSTTTLSEKSLQMCTETLGNETGSEMSTDEKMSLFSFSSSSSSDDETITRLSKTRELRALKKISKPKTSFPPPLASISGPISIKVKSQRENGRLILKAVSFPSIKPCFQVERGGGRLRLRLLKHCFADKEMEKEEENIEEEEEEEEEEEAEAEAEAEEGIIENNEHVGGEMGIEKCSRASRCKEGVKRRKGLTNWKPFLVST